MTDGRHHEGRRDVGFRLAMAGTSLLLPAWFCWRDNTELALLMHLTGAFAFGWILADVLVPPERRHGRFGAFISAGRLAALMVACIAVVVVYWLWGYHGVDFVAADLRQGFALAGIGLSLSVYGVARRRHGASWFLLALSVGTLVGLLDLAGTPSPKRTVYSFARALARGDMSAVSALTTPAPAGRRLKTGSAILRNKPDRAVWVRAGTVDGTATADLFLPVDPGPFAGGFGKGEHLYLVRAAGGQWLVVVPAEAGNAP